LFFEKKSLPDLAGNFYMGEMDAGIRRELRDAVNLKLDRMVAMVT